AKLPVHEGVETRDIRAHAVGRQLAAGDVEAEGRAVPRPIEVQPLAVEPQLALARYLGGGLVLREALLRQGAELHALAQLKAWLRNARLHMLALHVKPDARRLRDDAALLGQQVVVFVQARGVAAVFAVYPVALAGHAELSAALGAPEEQLVEVFRHAALAVKLHAGLLVPLVVVVV